MDFAVSTSSASVSSTTHDVDPLGEHHVLPVEEDHETTCWGCGIRLLVSPHAPVFKCGWCGAITNKDALKTDNRYYRWRRFRDRFFVGALLLFMLFIIGGGIWAVYPFIFSISLFCGAFHSVITIVLSLSTLSTFCLAAFQSPGAPPRIVWGSYPAVGKGGLDNFTFCQYCSRPKSPRTHHCRSCGMCVLDMDHHCPFIGNCVGAANHRSFIVFLISAVTSTIYVSLVTAFAALQLWPSFKYQTHLRFDSYITYQLMFKTLKEAALSFLRSAVFFTPKGLVLVYLFMASVSVEIGLSVLLWQQLCYIYKGRTYLSNLSASDNDEGSERDCRNFVSFFGCQYAVARYFPSFWNSKKIHKK